MNPQTIHERFLQLTQDVVPRPGGGDTASRHRAIFAAGRENMSLAKLIEAHWDAVAILLEAGKEPAAGAAYAVWASETAGKPLRVEKGRLQGLKGFCSGANLVDRALITAGTTLVEIDLRSEAARLSIDESGWRNPAFQATNTAAITFHDARIAAIVGEDGWYTGRAGFWQGACGPAAAWAGGAAGLLDYAREAKRDDPHTMAHLGAMYANIRAMEVALAAAGDAIDAAPERDSMVEALALRHTVEHLCTDVLQRFARAFGPAPLVKDGDVAMRYAELDLYLRQSHAERDLAVLGEAVRRRSQGSVHPFPPN